MSNDEIIALIGASTSMFVVLFIYAFAFLLGIAMWIAMQIPFYKMAKNQGMRNAWLMFVPYGNFYLTLKLTKREFNLFNTYRTYDRTKPFWVLLISTVIYIVLLFPAIIIFMIPVLGMIVFIAYILAYCLIAYGIIWRMYYDVLITYGMEENAMLLSVLNVFFPFIMLVVGYIIMNRKPDFTA